MARGLAALITALALAACSGGTSQPTSGASAPGATSGGATVCTDSTDATTVEATVGGFQWGPVTAKVGDVITWTNSDSAPHKVGLDDGSCTMSGNIAGGGGKASLVFSVAGTYPFHCTIHSQMKGTITIAG